MRDTATKVPAEYAPPAFKSSALQHSKPTLTWDADNADRKRVLARHGAAAEEGMDDLAAYLASPSASGSDSDAREDNVESAAALRARCALVPRPR